MRARVTMSAHPGHFVFWVVLVFFVLSAAGCEAKQKNPATSSDKNMVAPNITLFEDPTQWYVSTSGDDANQCHSTADTCRNIQTAIDRASNEDTIHIADGEYYEQLNITKPLEIFGTSMTNTIIDAQLVNRPLTLDGMGTTNGFKFELSDITLTGGATGKGGGLSIERGGYIVLTNVEIRNNVGHSAGGGIYSDDTSWLILDNVSIHDNQTGTGEGRGGGIFFSTGEDKQGYFPAFFKMDIWGSQIFHNNATTGAGIFNGATMRVIDTKIESNTAVSVGGGIYNEYDISIGRCKILNNTAKSGGGVFNGSDYLPGIIPGAEIFETEISGNSAITGGGILNEQGLNLTSSTIYNNTATGKGGGVYNATFFDSYPGGTDWAGIFYSINSTISGNSAASGGGIWNGDQSGGGIIPGFFEGAHMTIVDNTGGGIYYHYGSLKLRSVLFSNNGQNCDFTAEFTVVSSISSDDTCPGFIETDPSIGALKDNGGSTKTHALLPGSPARDAAIDYPSLYTDQRGFERPLDGDGDGVAKWDIGAFEAEYVAFPIKQLVPTYTPTPILGTQIFIPKEYPPCRQGPAFPFAAVGLLDPNTSYSVLGANQDRSWLALQYSPNTRCWVRAKDGQLSGDSAFLEVIPFTIVTITITPTITPTDIISTFDCGKYTSSDQCSMDNRCQWGGAIAPHCENK